MFKTFFINLAAFRNFLFLFTLIKAKLALFAKPKIITANLQPILNERRNDYD